MKDLKLDQSILNYREMIESNQMILSDILKMRSKLLSLSPKDQMILGGDKYIRLDHPLEIKKRYDKNNFCYYLEIKNISDDLIRFFKSLLKKIERFNDYNPKIDQIDLIIKSFLEIYKIRLHKDNRIWMMNQKRDHIELYFMLF